MGGLVLVGEFTTGGRDDSAREITLDRGLHVRGHALERMLVVAVMAGVVMAVMGRAAAARGDEGGGRGDSEREGEMPHDTPFGSGSTETSHELYRPVNGETGQRGSREVAIITLCLLTAVLVLSLVAGLVVHRHALIGAAGLAAMLALAIGWPWLSVAGATVVIVHPPRHARARAAFRLRVRVTNGLPIPLYRLTIDLGPVGGLALIDRIRPFARAAELDVTIIPARRGVVNLARGTISCGFPFELFHRRQPLRASGEIVVWPGKAVAPILLLPPRTCHVDSGTANDHLAGNETGGIRPYRPGDPMRRIHWQATARHDCLLAREQHSLGSPTVRIALHLGHGGDDACEHAIERAAAAIDRCAEQGFAIGQILPTQDVAPAAGEEQRRRLLDALARIDLGSSLARRALSQAALRRADLVVCAEGGRDGQRADAPTAAVASSENTRAGSSK